METLSQWAAGFAPALMELQGHLSLGFSVAFTVENLLYALVGEDHRFALPLAALTGALILSGASVFAKLISPGAVVPVGIITAVAGVPMLLGIIVSRKGGI